MGISKYYIIQYMKKSLDQIYNRTNNETKLNNSLNESQRKKHGSVIIDRNE